MILRESGMPPQEYWETLLDVTLILDAFDFGQATGDVAELGCGYGTFTMPLARRVGGIVHAFDIDPAMAAMTADRAAAGCLANVRATTRDVLADGFGLPVGSCAAALLFNILHAEEPVTLLRAAHAVVVAGGLVAVIHWRSDLPTPRGPSLAIRPGPDQIACWAEAAGLQPEDPVLDLPPWHFGLKLRRP
jgi:SAM-dependent methyltransferase